MTEQVDEVRNPWLTVPNILCYVRFGGAFVLVALARGGHGRVYVGLFLVLLLTDWLDGRLARLLHQRTEIGARLDSVADVTLYLSMLPSFWWLRPDFLRNQAWSIGIAALAYLVSVIVSLVKFGRLPAYHTRLAKICWGLVALALVALFAGGPEWPGRLTLVAVTVATVEAIAISLVLPGWRTNVPSIYHAWRLAKRPP